MPTTQLGEFPGLNSSLLSLTDLANQLVLSFGYDRAL